MPDHPEIYRSQAEQYEALVSREDYQGNLLPALLKITSFNDKRVVEFGAGTGRLTIQIAPLVKSIQAFDISQHMLDLAAQKLTKSGLTNWHIQTADHRFIPAADRSAEVILSGWSVCYVVVDHPKGWQAEIDKVLAEMDRILVPGGKIILIETLGTGFEQPTPPDHLVEYYAHLESQGFSRSWVRTDYRFENIKIARDLSKFFFGNAMLEKIVSDTRGITLPECTGIWSK
ncbi:class I SAM-dependent methyltransferase [bacterium]|nr:class I SAM-dependent methyltransferase [bacterium]